MTVPVLSGSSLNNSPRFCHQHDEEYHEMKKARRSGRPPTTKEDLLRMKMEALHKEERDGFCKPSHVVFVYEE